MLLSFSSKGKSNVVYHHVVPYFVKVFFFLFIFLLAAASVFLVHRFVDFQIN